MFQTPSESPPGGSPSPGIQFRPASREESHQRDDAFPADEELPYSGIRFRPAEAGSPPAGSDSRNTGSVELIKPAPNAPSKRPRDDVELVRSPKRKRADDVIMISDDTNEKKGKEKVLSGGEIDDAFDDAFGENADEEPEDVAWPTEKEVPEEAPQKEPVESAGKVQAEGKKDNMVQEKSVLGKALEKSGNDKGFISKPGEGKSTEDKSGHVQRQQAKDSNKALQADPGAIGRENPAKANPSAITGKDGQVEVTAASKTAKKAVPANADQRLEDKKEGMTKSGSPAQKKKDLSEKSTGDGKNAKSEQDVQHGESDEEEAPLDLASFARYEHGEVAKLTPTQHRRYEQYRRSDLKNPKVKKVLVSYNPTLQKASDLYIIAVKGLAKLFVGDVVETALDVKNQMGDKGALQPKHLREAYRRLRRSGVVPSTSKKSASFS